MPMFLLLRSLLLQCRATVGISPTTYSNAGATTTLTERATTTSNTRAIATATTITIVTTTDTLLPR
jgi:hypothetical protein